MATSCQQGEVLGAKPMAGFEQSLALDYILTRVSRVRSRFHTGSEDDLIAVG